MVLKTKWMIIKPQSRDNCISFQRRNVEIMAERARFPSLEFGTKRATGCFSCGCDRQSSEQNCNHCNPPVVLFTPQLRKKDMKTTKTVRKAGFTLVEIMIVVAIIGLLAAIAIPNFVRARATSQANACINNMRQIDAAVNEWALEQGKTTGSTATQLDRGSDTLHQAECQQRNSRMPGWRLLIPWARWGLLRKSLAASATRLIRRTSCRN